MTSSISPRSLRRFPAVWTTALLGASGCGGGAGSSDSIAPPATVGYAYVAASPGGAGNPGAVYEYAVKTDFPASALSPVSIGAGVQPAAVAVGVNHVYVVNVGDGTASCTWPIQATTRCRNSALVATANCRRSHRRPRLQVLRRPRWSQGSRVPVEPMSMWPTRAQASQVAREVFLNIRSTLMARSNSWRQAL